MVVMKIEKWIADALVHCLEEGQPPAERYGRASVAIADRYYKLESPPAMNAATRPCTTNSP